MSTSSGNEQTPKKLQKTSTRSPRRRKKRISHNSSGDEHFDIAIEETIQSCMDRNKELNPAGIKKLLKKLVKNEHVLAIVRLQEEEMQKKTEERGSEADDEDDEVTIKITRSKAKQLDQELLPLFPLKPRTIPSEDSKTLALLHQDLHDDDTDPEYNPNEDELNLTTSDFDSLPATPKSAGRPDMESVQYSADGKFKIPRRRAESVTQSEGEEEPIFMRTRTKKSYKAATVEELQLSNAPDIVSDMDRENYDLNPEWQKFLFDYTKPVYPEAEEEDDENDPEFNPSEEPIIEVNDKEEMRNVAISETEINNLLKNLVPMLDDDWLNEKFEKELDPTLEIERKLRSPRSTRRQKINTPLSTPPPRKMSPQLESPNVPEEVAFKPDLASSTIIISDKDCLLTREPLLPTICLKTDELQSLKLSEVLNSSEEPSSSSFQDITIRIPVNCKNITIQTSSAETTPMTEQIIYVEQPPTVIMPKIDQTTEELVDVSAARFAFFDFYSPELPDTKYGMLPEQYEILVQQMRIHVQFCTQFFLQSFAHPKFWSKSSACEKLLKELRDSVPPHLWPCNLIDAMQLIENWKNKMNDESTNFGSKTVEWFIEEQEKFEKISSKKYCYRPQLAPQIMKEILYSPVFMYTEFLPTCAFKFFNGKQSKVPFSIGEEALLAIGLEKYESCQYVVRVKNKNHSSLSTWTNGVTQKMFYNTRNAKVLYNHTLACKSSKELNAINYYFECKRAPGVKHKILPVNGRPCDRFDELPKIWKKFVEKLHKEVEHPSQTEKGKKVPKKEVRREESPFTRVVKNLKFAEFTIPINIEVLCSEVQDPQPVVVKPDVEVIREAEQLCDVDDIPLALRIAKSIQKPKTPKPLNKSNSQVKKVQQLQKHLSETVKRCHEKYDCNAITYAAKQNLIVKLTYEHCKAIDLFTELLKSLRKMCAATNTKKIKLIDPTQFEPPQKRTKLNDDKRSKPSSNSENPDMVYSMNFVEKVEETMMAQNNQEDFDKFLETLKSFDSTKDKVADLYFKMEKIFHPNYPELLSLFLTFLLPGQAAEVGKYFEYFMMQNMTTFRDKLNHYFAKTPGQIRKIYACLNEMALIENISMETVKESILPLLKGNQMLISWFLQIFPTEKPMDCSEADSEMLPMKYKNEQQHDIYEEYVLSEPVNSNETTSSCGVKYVGGIMYSGRMCTLPAKLAFLAYDSVVKSTTETSDACAHAVAEFAESKVQEKSKLTLQVKEEDLDASTEEPQIANKYIQKVHAIRLNPSVYASNGESYQDIAHLLTSPPIAAERFFNEDAKSPKKNSKIKKLLSPPKAASKLTKSPSCIKKTPLSPGPIMKAKKLKALIADPKEKPEDTPEPLPEPISWTRDEDRIILKEEQQRDSQVISEFISNLKEKLINRSTEEIEKRYEFLMEFVRRIQDGNT